MMVQFSNAEVSSINSSSTYQSKSGSVSMMFEMSGSRSMAIDLSSIRLLCNVDFLTGSNQHLNNNGIYKLGILDGATLAPQATKVDSNPVFDFANQSYVSVDPRTGCSGIIGNVLYQDADNNTLENIHSYSHMMNKQAGLSLSKYDMLTNTSSSYGISGGGKSLITQAACNSTNILAIKIYSGLSNSQIMPYSVVNGKLKLQINLNSSSSVFFGGNNHGTEIDEGTDRASLLGGCYYKLTNVKLIYKNLIFDQMDAPLLKSGYQFNHLTSLQDTINSSDNTSIYNPNSSNTMAIMSSFIESSKLNNYKKNSIQSGKLHNSDGPVQINTVNFLKNNISFPLTYPIDESIYTKNNISTKNNYTVQRALHYLTAMTPYTQLNKTLIHPSTENYGSFVESMSPDFDVPVCAGVAIRYSAMGNNDGTSFIGGQTFQQRINSGLNGTVNNEIFTSILSNKTIVPSLNGPVIVQ